MVDPLTPAARMRTYRKRRRNGLHYVQILLGPAEIEALVRTRLLNEDRRQDPEALRNAIQGFLDWALEDRRLAAIIAKALSPIGP